MEMSSDLSPILTVARDILRHAPGKAMHVDAIAAEAVLTNQNMTLSAELFSKKLQGALAGNLNLKTQKSIFARVAGKKGVNRRGWYRLKQEKTASAIAKVEPPEVTTGFVGRAGEFAVMGELLFWGYNVSMMAVDNGVDIVTEKNNCYFNVQVKTATESGERRYLFTIKRTAFLANDKSSMFYVLVIRKKVTSEYLVMPSSFIRTLLDAGAIGTGPILSLAVTTDDKGRRYVLNGSTDINLFVGNFGVIR
jgi:hypothetical protein